ncbi:MAG: tRNA 2-thiouridine(34) synthase MnmA [Clostridia bacterium]|jgi:tRNA-specific 2-thiouridylase
MKQTVVVGMSGGVDSSVAALLLKEQGYEVVGLFMNNWDEKVNSQCTAEADYEDVKRVCGIIGMPYYTVNFQKEYMDRVFTDFLEEYKKGRTPNPDVLCNREIKFGPFLDFAKKIGADYIATGHYSGILHTPEYSYLLKALDQTKDQTYFLNQLNQAQLKNVLFPLQNIMKTEVRKIALTHKLSTATKKDSTGICFIGERNFKNFLRGYIPAVPGEICTMQGKIIGEHSGLMFYTLGQRRGLNIGGVKGEQEGRWFVVKKDLQNNILYVSKGDESILYGAGAVSYKFNWIPCPPIDTEFECTAKFRYRQTEQDVKVKILDNRIEVVAKQPQRAITEGQWVVLYQGDKCIGGGIIEERL